MAKAKRLPSGNYRCQVGYTDANGNYLRKSFTAPTRKEAEYLASSFAIDTKQELYSNKVNITFKDAAKQYVDLKRNVLSQATIREYSRTCSRLPEWFQVMKVSEINDFTVQKVVNELSSSLSPKTVRDRHAFIKSVIGLLNPSIVFHTTLPQIIEKEPYIPTHEEVKALIDASVGTQYHVALQLAKCGLRREEICAVETSDLVYTDGLYYLYINKALVQDENKNWIVKTTKTTSSIRFVPISKELAQEILNTSSGRVFKGFPETISTFLRREQDKLGIQHFSLHKMRHYFCTTLSEKNIDEATILALGGWTKDSSVMKKIYRHSNIQRDKERLSQIVDILKQ